MHETRCNAKVLSTSFGICLSHTDCVEQSHGLDQWRLRCDIHLRADIGRSSIAPFDLNVPRVCLVPFHLPLNATPTLQTAAFLFSNRRYYLSYEDLPSCDDGRQVADVRSAEPGNCNLSCALLDSVVGLDAMLSNQRGMAGDFAILCF